LTLTFNWLLNLFQFAKLQKKFKTKALVNESFKILSTKKWLSYLRKHEKCNRIFNLIQEKNEEKDDDNVDKKRKKCFTRLVTFFCKYVDVNKES
jgi:hypothetical protein